MPTKGLSRFHSAVGAVMMRSGFGSPRSQQQRKAQTDNVRVMVRIRPFNDLELNQLMEDETPEPIAVAHSDTLVYTVNPEDEMDKHQYPFDQVFWSVPASQYSLPNVDIAYNKDVYQAVGVPALDNAFDGYNACIFAYGQTSCGKTHTMMGTPDEPGLSPALCKNLFDRIHNLHDNESQAISASVMLSYMEIYNEKVYDLIGPKRQSSLEIFTDPKHGPSVRGLAQVTVHDWTEVEYLLSKGNRARAMASTGMNDTSSRSHAIVQITMIQTEVFGQVGNKAISKERRSRLNLVDLAGSEKIAKSKVEGANLTEAININKSLTALGRVIDLLVEGVTHIPYRDAILTLLLSDSLGGNSRTTMLAMVSPFRGNFEETTSTLRYAVRARKIVNIVKVNEDPTAALIRELQDKVSAFEGGEGGAQAGEMNPQLLEEKAKLEEMVKALTERERADQAKIDQDRRQWREETQKLQQKHQDEMILIQEAQKELERRQALLQQESTSLKRGIEDHRRKEIVTRMKYAVAVNQNERTLAREKEGHAESRRDLVVSRLSAAATKTKLAEAMGHIEHLQKQLEDVSGQLETTDLARMEALNKAEDLEDEINRRSNNGSFGTRSIKSMNGIGKRHPHLGMQAPNSKLVQVELIVKCPHCEESSVCALRGTDPLPEPIWCDLCGEYFATIHCDECPTNPFLCNRCDVIVHNNPKNKFHVRHLLNKARDEDPDLSLAPIHEIGGDGILIEAQAINDAASVNGVMSSSRRGSAAPSIVSGSTRGNRTPRRISMPPHQILYTKKSGMATDGSIHISSHAASHIEPSTNQAEASTATPDRYPSSVGVQTPNQAPVRLPTKMVATYTIPPSHLPGETYTTHPHLSTPAPTLTPRLSLPEATLLSPRLSLPEGAPVTPRLSLAEPVTLTPRLSLQEGLYPTVHNPLSPRGGYPVVADGPHLRRFVST